MRKLMIMTLAAAGVLSAMGVAKAEETHWSDGISMKGDLRFRYEWIDKEGKDTRNRFRIRARLALKGEVNEDVDVHLRLASGSGDPVSRNQTLDGGFSSKDFRLDQAYVDWHPEVVEGVSLWAGKMKQPFVVVKDLIWDGDLTPEGAAIKYKLGGEALDVMANLAVLMPEERSSDDDTYLYGVQLAGKAHPGDGVSVLGGVSWFLYDNMEGFPLLFDDGNSFGNTTEGGVVDPATGEASDLVYANDFSEFEAFVKVSVNPGIPVSVYGDYVLNTDADNEDTGFMVGVTLGKAKEPGSAQVDYNYRDLEADAVVGAFSDSDYIGGGTGGDGHKIQGKYQLAKNWQFSATLFVTQIEDGDLDYDRAQVDLIAKF